MKESADKLIISVPGLTGKHIAQITTNSTQSSSPAESPKHTGEPLRVLAVGDPASPMELEPAIPEAGVIHPSHGMAVDMGRVHGGGGQMVGVPPGAKVMSVPMVATTAGAVSPGGHPQVPGLGVVAPSGSPSLSPGGGNSSPRPRILRAKRFERYTVHCMCCNVYKHGSERYMDWKRVEHTYPTLASCHSQLHGLASRTRGANTSSTTSSAVPVLYRSSVRYGTSTATWAIQPGYEAAHGREWRPYQRLFKPRTPANGRVEPIQHTQAQID